MAADPAEIEERIVATRAELADTVDELVDRLSPRRVATRRREALEAKVHAAVNGLSGLPEALGEDASVRWGRVAAAAGLLAAVVYLVRRTRRSGG